MSGRGLATSTPPQGLQGGTAAVAVEAASSASAPAQRAEGARRRETSGFIGSSLPLPAALRPGCREGRAVPTTDTSSVPEVASGRPQPRAPDQSLRCPRKRTKAMMAALPTTIEIHGLMP